ncbi:hypothetical protein [uncultured Tateyamaria sp.]|uniref:hypothetical protein n=1 Tax=uncultured Tateyamaria sp. TaxID=455651 RepID=UPI002627AD44|nr:hypothetical protein [uncultured Tateyamaria sp.]
MMKRFSVRNLDQDAIDMLAEIRAEERRELGAILEDCIQSYWSELFEAEAENDLAFENAA